MYINHFYNITIVDVKFLENTVTPSRPLPSGAAVMADHAKDIDFVNVDFLRNRCYAYSAYYCA